MNTVRLIPTLLIKFLLQTVYLISNICFPVQKRKIVFASYRTSHIEGNLLYLYMELKRRYPNYQYVQILKKPSSTTMGKIMHLFHMFKATYHLATSHYFFVDDYYFPLYIVKPRKITKVIQVWHGAGAFKKFGYSTIGKEFGSSKHYLRHVKIHSNYSKVIVSAKEVVPFFAEAFRMNKDKILPVGLPRADFLFQKDKHEGVKQKLYKKYPELKEKKLILFAPTYRTNQCGHSIKQTFIDFSQLYSILGDTYAVILKLHPYVESNLEIDNNLQGFVYKLDSEFETEEIIVISDILVTDYSSIIFDYSLMEQPIAFYTNDLEEYINERDFYYDYKSFVPGPIFNNTEKLANWIKSEDFDIGQIREFNHRFFDYLDGNSSKRVIDSIFEQKDTNGG